MLLSFAPSPNWKPPANFVADDTPKWEKFPAEITGGIFWPAGMYKQKFERTGHPDNGYDGWEMNWHFKGYGRFDGFTLPRHPVAPGVDRVKVD